MINFKIIRDSMISNLQSHLNIPVIDSNTVNKKPDSDYISFTIISLIAEEFENAKSILFVDTTKIQVKDVLQVYSFNAHSTSYEKANELALKCIEYYDFIFDSYADNITITGISNIQNRDIMIGEGRERRVGFEVSIRIESVVEKTETTIIDVPVNYQIGGK